MSHPNHVRALCASLCLGAGLPVHAGQGFLEDAKASLTARNFHLHRNFVGDASQGKAEEWTQSFILDARSGFTQGSVGFGLDVLGLYSLKLDGGKGTAGTQLLPIHDDGRPADDFGRLAVAGKLRVSNSELKIGEWMPVLPILRSDDGRSLPQTFRGGQLSANEIAGLTLYAGQFRGNSPRNDASMQDMSLFGRPAATSDRFDFAGGEYRFNGERSLLGLWNAELKDIYRQQYLQLQHSQPLGDWLLGANLGGFRGRDAGSARAGKLDNRTVSALFSARYGLHTLYLGLQKVSGDDGWMRVNGTSGGTLANDSYNASYDNPGERSWHALRLRLRWPRPTRPDLHDPLPAWRPCAPGRSHRRRQRMGTRERAGLHAAERRLQASQRPLAQLQPAPRLGQQYPLRREPADRQLSAEPVVKPTRRPRCVQRPRRQATTRPLAQMTRMPSSAQASGTWPNTSRPSRPAKMIWP